MHRLRQSHFGKTKVLGDHRDRRPVEGVSCSVGRCLDADAKYRCLRNRRPSEPNGFIGSGAMEVTKAYEFKGFGDIQGPKPYKFIGFRWTLISQTPVVLPPPVSRNMFQGLHTRFGKNESGQAINRAGFVEPKEVPARTIRRKSQGRHKRTTSNDS